MFARVLLSALALQSAAAWTLSQPPRTLTRTVRGSTPVDEPLEAEPAKPVDELAGATGIDGTKLRKPKSGQYDLRKDMDTSGAGFNQFDPVLSATGAISRRFGIGGGLALLALLAATEGSEIVKTLTAGTATAGDGAKITTASGLVYSDVLVGAKNGQPGPATGAIIGADIRLSIGDKVLYDTKGDKAVAFKLGQRPFQNVICEGVEEALLAGGGMRPGGKRIAIVPAKLAPPGVNVPEGTELVYEITLNEILPGYF